MINAKDFVSAIQALHESKGISTEIVVESLKQAMINAYQKSTGNKDAMVRVDIDLGSGQLKVYNLKNIVEEVTDDALEISLEDARETNANAQVGEQYEILVPTDGEDYNRGAAQQVKQILKQKIREAEKQAIYDAYITKKDDIILGIVEKVDKNYCLINIGKTTAMMSSAHKIPNENYFINQQIKVYVVDVNKNSQQGAQVLVSRADPGFIKRLFEQEIVEIYDGTVEIRSIAREPGERAKVAVYSRNPNVDAPGACIGPKGMRIQKVSSQLSGEKIDVIAYSDEPELYISEALKPAEVLGMKMDVENHAAVVVVPNNGLSLAIGKRGQNARLAVKLTNWKIDIKTVDSALAERIDYETMAEIKERIAQKNAMKDVKEEIVEPIETIEPVTEVVPAVEEEVVAPIETPVVEATPEVTPEPVMEEKVEEQPSIVEIVAPSRPLKSLADLEKEIERERKAPKPVVTERPTYRNFKEKDPEKDKLGMDRKDSTPIPSTQPQSFMPVYSAEELKELDETYEEEDNSKYDEDIDFDEFDKYYDK